MIGNDVEAAPLERLEDGPVHGRAIDAEMSEVVIVEYQGHEIEVREFGRHGILEWPDNGGDRRGLDAGASESAVALLQGNGRRTRRTGRRRRRRRRGCSGRGGRM